MLNFNYRNSTRILFGKGALEQLDQVVPLNAKILLTYGAGSIKQNGVLESCLKALGKRSVTLFGGIEPNPDYATLIKAVFEVKAKGLDFLLSVGGGSVLDGTKFIAAASLFEGEPWDLLEKRAPIERALPIGAVMTLAATGSESNGVAVISRRETGDKLALSSELLFPDFAVLDPTFTFTMPLKQIANGVVDTYIHVLEQYLTYPVDSPVQDRFSEGLLLTLLDQGPKALEERTNYNLRANLMWAACLGWNGLIGQGVPQDWATHRIGHELTALYGLDHACAIAVVLPSLWRVQALAKAEKMLQYGQRVFGIEEGDEQSRIEKSIEKTREFFERMGISTRLSEYGLGEEAVQKVLANFKRHNRTALGEHRDITPDKVKEILTMAL